MSFIKAADLFFIFASLFGERIINSGLSTKDLGHLASVH